MDILYIIFFMLLGGGIGWGITYLWANYRYNNKEEVDKCYKERTEYKQENENLKEQIKELQNKIDELIKELESAHREIAEKNKYLSEDKVIVERLYEVKLLSDKISSILIDYDKATIQHLLKEYQGGNYHEEDEHIEDEEYNENKKIGW